MVKSYIMEAYYLGTSLTVSQKKVWEEGDMVSYVGADKNANGKMCVVFMDNAGKVYHVENDVVFTYQKNGKPISKGNYA